MNNQDCNETTTHRSVSTHEHDGCETTAPWAQKCRGLFYDDFYIILHLFVPTLYFFTVILTPCGQSTALYVFVAVFSL